MNKALDEQCAALLGWHKGTGGAINAGTSYESPVYWYDADGRQWGACVADDFANLHAFSPSSNLFDAKLLEDAIERAGRVELYTVALWQLVKADFSMMAWDTNFEANLWLVLRATPEQHAWAFVAAMTGTTQ